MESKADTGLWSFITHITWPAAHCSIQRFEQAYDAQRPYNGISLCFLKLKAPTTTPIQIYLNSHRYVKA